MLVADDAYWEAELPPPPPMGMVLAPVTVEASSPLEEAEGPHLLLLGTCGLMLKGWDPPPLPAAAAAGPLLFCGRRAEYW